MIMTLLLAADSNRPMITLSEAGKGSLHPWSLLTAVIPHLYGISRPLGDYWGPPKPGLGVRRPVPRPQHGDLLFRRAALLGLLIFPFVLRFRPRFVGNPEDLAASRDPYRSDALFLFFSFVLLMLYSLGRYTPFFGVVFSLIPGIDKFRRPADALFLACACGSMAGGYAIHRCLRRQRFACLSGHSPPSLPLWRAARFLAPCSQ